jgi:uncharacterized protein (DUF486 family)
MMTIQIRCYLFHIDMSKYLLCLLIASNIFVSFCEYENRAQKTLVLSLMVRMGLTMMTIQIRCYLFHIGMSKYVLFLLIASNIFVSFCEYLSGYL